MAGRLHSVHKNLWKLFKISPKYFYRISHPYPHLDLTQKIQFQRTIRLKITTWAKANLQRQTTKGKYKQQMTKGKRQTTKGK